MEELALVLSLVNIPCSLFVLASKFNAHWLITFVMKLSSIATLVVSILIILKYFNLL